MSETLVAAPQADTGSVGTRLRAARQAAGLDLSDVANKTRIPLRHLLAIEDGDFSVLPTFTYAAGFVRAFARAVGADEVSLARELRTELGREGDARTSVQDDDVADPARVPPRWLAWSAAIVLILFAGGYALWRSTLLSVDTPEMSAPAPAAKPVAKPQVAATPTALGTGPVVLTATDDVWFRVYDRNDKVLFEGVKKKGEVYAVPADADTPMIRTGRADQLAVTIGGALVPPLGPAETTVKDVVISSAGLAARSGPSALPSTSTGPATAAQP